MIVTNNSPLWWLFPCSVSGSRLADLISVCDLNSSGGGGRIWRVGNYRICIRAALRFHVACQLVRFHLFKFIQIIWQMTSASQLVSSVVEKRWNRRAQKNLSTIQTEKSSKICQAFSNLPPAVSSLAWQMAGATISISDCHYLSRTAGTRIAISNGE